jgi:hypothetical protein
LPARRRFAILNDVVLNQVLVSFGSADETRRVIAGIQDDGTCWCGGTEWHGPPLIFTDSNASLFSSTLSKILEEGPAQP